MAAQAKREKSVRIFQFLFDVFQNWRSCDIAMTSQERKWKKRASFPFWDGPVYQQHIIELNNGISLAKAQTRLESNKKGCTYKAAKTQNSAGA